MGVTGNSDAIALAQIDCEFVILLRFYDVVIMGRSTFFSPFANGETVFEFQISKRRQSHLKHFRATVRASIT